MEPELRIRELAAEIVRLEGEVQVLDHQIDFQGDVAEDARIRAIVSEAPLEARASREAGDDLARLVRVRDEARARIVELRAQQDKLLDAMLGNT